MLRKTKTWIGIFLLVILPGMAYAQNEKDDLAQEIYARSGMEKQFAQIPALVQAGVDHAASADDRLQNLPGDFLKNMKDLARGAFAPETFRETIVSELHKKLSLRELKDIIKWLDSPLGDKISRLEEAASTPENLAKMAQYAAQLQNSPPPSERLTLLRKFDDAVKGTQNSVDMMMETQIAVAMAVVSTLPVEQQVPRAHVAKEMEKAKPEIEAAAKIQTLVSMLYTYQSLSAADLQKYIDFLSSSAGSKYQSVSMAAFRKVFFDSSVKWGKGIGKALQKANDKSRT